MSQEFRLSIKNFSQRKIVNVKDIFKNLTETEKAILEREKQLSEEKFKRTKQHQQQHNHQTANNPKKKINLTKNSEFSKSSVNLPAKTIYEQQTHNNHHHYHFNQQQRQSKPNRYKIDYDETLSNRPWLLNEANFEENYEENFKRYISQIDLNKIINEKKLKKKNDFNFNQNQQQQQQQQKYYQHQTPVFRRESLVFINDQNEDQKLNKFNGFKKKIKNLFNNNESTKFTEHNNNNNNNNRPIHLIRLQSQQQDPNQYINNNNNDNFISDPFYIEATTNKKWNNHNKNFKYKSPLIKEYMYMNNHHTNNNNNNNNETFTGQNDNNNNNKFRKLSNLLNRTKNLLH